MATPAPLRMTATEWGMLIGLSVLWGGSFFLIEVALEQITPFTVVFLRVALAAVTMMVVLKVVGHRLPATLAGWKPLLLLGFINNALPFSFLTWGQSQITGGLASILNAATPLVTVLVAHMLTDDERMTPGRVTGVAIGLTGVIVMVGPSALNGLGGDLPAQLSCLAATVCYAFGTLYARRFVRMGYPALVTVTGQFTAAALFLLPVVLLIDRPWTLAAPDPATVLAVVTLAVVSTAAAYLVYFRILNSAGATNIALVTFLVPATAIGLGILFLNEVLAARHVLGFALIGTGLAAIDGRSFGWLRARLRRS